MEPARYAFPQRASSSMKPHGVAGFCFEFTSVWLFLRTQRRNTSEWRLRERGKREVKSPIYWGVLRKVCLYVTKRCVCACMVKAASLHVWLCLTVAVLRGGRVCICARLPIHTIKSRC